MKRTESTRWISILTGLCACAAPLSLASAQSVLLKPRFVVGKTVYVESSTQAAQTIRGPMFGEEGMIINFDQMTGTLQKVVSAGDEGVKLTITIDRVRMETDAMMMAGSFDSDARSDDELLEFAEVLEPMVGASYTAELDADANVIRMVGVDQIAEKMSAAGAGQMTSQLVQNVTNEQYRAALAESTFMLYPNKKVKVGDTWSKSLTRKAGPVGELKVAYDYRVESIKDDRVVISYVARLERASDAQVDTGNPMIKAINFKKGSITGTAEFDAKSGQLLGAKRKSVVKLIMEMNSPTPEEGAASSMTLDVETTETLKFMTEAQRAAQRTENKKKAAKAKKDGG